MKVEEGNNTVLFYWTSNLWNVVEVTYSTARRQQCDCVCVEAVQGSVCAWRHVLCRAVPRCICRRNCDIILSRSHFPPRAHTRPRTHATLSTLRRQFFVDNVSCNCYILYCYLRIYVLSSVIKTKHDSLTHSSQHLIHSLNHNRIHFVKIQSGS